MKPNYKFFKLPDGTEFQIKFDEEGIVYDVFDKDGEHIQSFGYDYYHEIRNIPDKSEILDFAKWCMDNGIVAVANRTTYWYDARDGSGQINCEKTIEEIYELFKKEKDG